MHASERAEAIVTLMKERGFLSFRELEKRLSASPATLRRDLERLQAQGIVARVHGGARLVKASNGGEAAQGTLVGVPFNQNVGRNRKQKEAIGRAAAELCIPGEAVMIDGGSTTLQMCQHLSGLGLQVLTNSLHIVEALLPQTGTRVSVPGGVIFREQNIILSAPGDELMPDFHAPKFFMGAAAIGPRGVMQPDVVLVAAERRFLERAEQFILLVDSSKFESSSGNVVCGLEDVDIVITDQGIPSEKRRMLEDAGVQVIIAG